MDLKKILVLAVIIAGIFMAVKFFKGTDAKAFQSMSEQRIATIFENLKPGADRQKAIGFWRKGGNEPATEGALAAFERWLGKKNLKMKIDSYKLTSSRVEGGDDVVNRYAIVNFKVDGRQLSAKVRQGCPVEWAG